MRTEIEFSLRFIFDPKEEVKPEELEMLEGAVELAKKLRTMSPAMMPEGKLIALEALRERVRPNTPHFYRHGQWEEKHRIAEEAMATTNGNLSRAATSLGIAYNTFRMWLNGGPTTRKCGGDE